MKKILVTGATGFIGRYVVAELVKHNCTVIATASSEKNRDVGQQKEVIFIPFDFRDYDAHVNYYDFFLEPEIMIHLAWEGLPNYKALFHFEENLSGHYALLKNMITNGLKNITVTGTCLEYGFKEGCLSEEMETSPGNAYALAKDTLRKFLQELQKFYPFSLKWLRLFYMYGKGQSPNSILSHLDKAIESGESTFNMSGGEQVRDYLPVEKVAEYITKAALQKDVEGIINCCSGNPVKLKDLVENYLKKRNSTISLNLGYYPYLDYEPMNFWGDTTKLQTILKNEKPY